MNYILRYENKNILSVDSCSKRFEVFDSNLLPFALQVDELSYAKHIKPWLLGRVYNNSRHNIDDVLNCIGIDSNFNMWDILDITGGYSAFDKYWIVKEGSDKTFKSRAVYSDELHLVALSLKPQDVSVEVQGTPIPCLPHRHPSSYYFSEDESTGTVVINCAYKGYVKTYIAACVYAGIGLPHVDFESVEDNAYLKYNVPSEDFIPFNDLVINFGNIDGALDYAFKYYGVEFVNMLIGDYVTCNTDRNLFNCGLNNEDEFYPLLPMPCILPTQRHKSTPFHQMGYGTGYLLFLNSVCENYGIKLPAYVWAYLYSDELKSIFQYFNLEGDYAAFIKRVDEAKHILTFSEVDF